MKKTFLITTLFLCLLNTLATDAMSLTDQDLSNPELMKILNNYFGCRTWTSGVCTECSQNYYFNSEGICCEVKPQCRVFNRQVGICEGCYQGYHITDGSCVLTNTTNSQEQGCRKWTNGVCSECSSRWYFNLNKICTPVDDYCRTWNATGNCQLCYPGYVIQNQICIRDPFEFVPGPNDLCAEWKDRVCLRCAPRAYFNQNGRCEGVNANCNTWDQFDGVCLTCYTGYTLANGICTQSQQTGPSDLGCKSWDWKTQRCLECSTRWVFGNSGVCVPVSDVCLNFNTNGVCTACYKGYNLVNGTCQLSQQTGPTDLGCKTWDWDNQRCLECSQRWLFNANRVCVQLSDVCSTFNSNGVCTACYKGYNLVNGTCQISQQTGPSDLGCKTWNWDTQRCLECSQRWIFSPNGACIPLSDVCSTFNSAGVCTACYKGYTLANGICQISQQTGPSDLGCKTWNWDSQRCLECSARWVLNANGKCTPVSDTCSTFNSAGVCTACYKGYNLVNGICQLSQQTGPSDLGCKTWNWDSQRCLECSQRWILNANGKCTPVSDVCSTFNSAGVCTACYKGYTLANGICQISQQTGPSDLGCKTWDWNNQRCLECSTRWIFNINRVCVPVSDVCSAFNSAGVCTACYKGYNLVNGTCQISQQTGPSDLGCKTWNWDNQTCLECSQRWVFNANRICVKVSDSCSTFNSNGVCTACYKGYSLINGNCQLSQQTGPSDLGCKTWNWNNQTCLECSARWVFNANGKCTPVSDTCSTFNSAGVCTACYKGYTLTNGICQLSQQTGPTDIGCKTWDWDNQRCLECSARWVFNLNRLCVPVSDVCSTFSSNGTCTACYKGYNLVNSTCQLTPQTGPTDIGCKTWDWDNKRCLECSSRWAFSANGICTPVSDFCQTFNSQGVCTSCYNGYALQNGVCQVQNVLCKTVSANGNCLTCYSGYVLYQQQCVAISKLASLAQYYAACCPEKLAELKIQGRIN